MTELSKNLREFLRIKKEIAEFKKRVSDLYALKITVLRYGMEVILEEEIEKLKVNAVRNQKEADDLKKRIQQLTADLTKIQNFIKGSIPLNDRWVRVSKPDGFFLVKKSRIESAGVEKTILIVDAYNEEDERMKLR